MNLRQPLKYRLLIWDRHIQIVEGLNMFVCAQSSPKLGLIYNNITQDTQDQTIKNQFNDHHVKL